MPIKKGLVEENVSTKVLAALSTAFGREISFVDDLTYSEYETELKEAMMKVHPDRGGDEETFQILSAERDRIRGNNTREQFVTEKRTTISGAKLLPGTTFRTDDLKPSEVDEDSVSSNVNIADRLNNIADALGVIGGLFKLELSSLQDKEEKDLQDKARQNKEKRESELEGKKGADKKKKDADLKVPKLGFLTRLGTFFRNVALGAVSIKVLDWLKNPANQENVGKMADWLTNNAGKIFNGLFIIAGIDVATRLLTLASGISQVLLWLGGAPLLIGAIIIALGTLGTVGLLKAKKDYDNQIKSMEKEAVERGFVYDDGTPDLSALRLRYLYERYSSVDEEGKYKYPQSYAAQLTWPEYIKQQSSRRFYPVPEETAKNALKGMAKGGRPPVDEVVSVGEQGRELFIADTPGTIVSNNKTEHVFDSGALLVAKSNVIDKASSISQKVGKKRTPNLIDLRGKSKGSSPNPTFSTGGQIEGVSSVDNSNIDLYSSSLLYGLTGAN
jgi:hypothetical protein